MNIEKAYAEKIAAEYAPKQTSKVVALKKLDKKAKLGANIFGYTFGIISTLLLGIGLCFGLGAIVTNELYITIIGYALGVIGLIGVSINYFIYKKLLEKGKQKYGSDIIALAKEIAQE